MPTVTLLVAGPVDAPEPLPIELATAISATQSYAALAQTAYEGVRAASIAGASDAAIASPQPGDFLRYGSGSKWVNDPLVDGGNF